MGLRHLRCFLAVAEERHFAHAAGRLHIEPSPLLRTFRHPYRPGTGNGPERSN